MKNLQLFDLDLVDNVVSPELFEHTELDSPATKVFTDFKMHQPLVIEGDTLASDALLLMKKSHVKMKIVVSSNNDFLGIISTNELSEQSLIAETAKGKNRNEILVSDMMLPKLALHAFDFSEIENSTVNDVILTLKNYGLRHCLVVDRKHHHIRGVISTSDIARKLHLPIDLSIKTSFSEIFEVIHGAAVL
ncbi:CBS domain-containing protein [Thalassotalea sp. G2M2-11]|uniref:CBS domain-containing protein n=1 Tax=Thalassotalea sp. G2M2-11 TaxID=2787627 RepID=UPI0019D2A61C|nr:CBS domain-containing protein [Thalassotalea sp. G2M2-11]